MPGLAIKVRSSPKLSSRALCLMGRLGRGSPRLEWRWLGTLGLPPWGVEMSLGEEQEKQYLELKEIGEGLQGVCGYERF